MLFYNVALFPSILSSFLLVYMLFFFTGCSVLPPKGDEGKGFDHKFVREIEKGIDATNCGVESLEIIERGKPKVKMVKKEVENIVEKIPLESGADIYVDMKCVKAQSTCVGV